MQFKIVWFRSINRMHETVARKEWIFDVRVVKDDDLWCLLSSKMIKIKHTPGYTLVFLQIVLFDRFKWGFSKALVGKSHCGRMGSKSRLADV